MKKRTKNKRLKINLPAGKRYWKKKILVRIPQPSLNTSTSLERVLCEILQSHAGERGEQEGAIDCLCRIIRERDRAFLTLALDRLKEPSTAARVLAPSWKPPLL